MVTITKAKTAKELGINNSTAGKILKLAQGNKKTPALGARAISEEIGVPRRRVMRWLEVNGIARFSPNSYL